MCELNQVFSMAGVVMPSLVVGSFVNWHSVMVSMLALIDQLQLWWVQYLLGVPKIHTVQTVQIPLDGPRPPHAKRPHHQKPPVWRAGHWKETRRVATAAVPQCRETWHDSGGHRLLGEPGSHVIQMERNPNQIPQFRGGEADKSCHGMMCPQKAKWQLQ